MHATPEFSKWLGRENEPFSGKGSFRREHDGDWRIYYHTRFAPHNLKEALALVLQSKPPLPRELSEPPDTSGVCVLHSGKKSDVVGIRLSNRTSIACKFIHDQRIWAKIRNHFKRSKARRAFSNGWQLELRELPAPRILGYAERLPFGPSMLFMELIPGWEKLQNVLRDDLPDPARQLELASGAGTLSAKMHAHGVAHMDWSTRNLMMRKDEDDPNWQIVDFEELRFYPYTVPWPTARQNLIDLAVCLPGLTARQALRFLRSYLHEKSGKQPAAPVLRKLLKAKPFKEAKS